MKIKIKTIKVNQIGLLRSDRATPNVEIPLNDLQSDNIDIINYGHYIRVNKR